MYVMLLLEMEQDMQVLLNMCSKYPIVALVTVIIVLSREIRACGKPVDCVIV